MTILIDADGCPEDLPVAAEAQKEKVADPFEPATSGGDGGIRTHVPG